MGTNSNRTAPKSSRRRRFTGCALSLFAGAGLLVMTLISPRLAAQQQTSPGGSETIYSPPRPTSIILPAANHGPDANDRMEMQSQKLKRAGFEAANAERKRQLDSDSALLLKLASELKAEIDKTPPDTLSLSIVRKAEEIEHLAHDVQVKMKLTVGAD